MTKRATPNAEPLSVETRGQQLQERAPFGLERGVGRELARDEPGDLREREREHDQRQLRQDELLGVEVVRQVAAPLRLAHVVAPLGERLAAEELLLDLPSTAALEPFPLQKPYVVHRSLHTGSGSIR